LSTTPDAGLTAATDVGGDRLSAAAGHDLGLSATAPDIGLSTATANIVSHGVSSSLCYCLTILDVPAATTFRTGFAPAYYPTPACGLWQQTKYDSCRIPAKIP
jgi:hypothetical protein